MLLRIRIGSLGIACSLLAACGGGGSPGPTQMAAPTATPTIAATSTPAPTATPTASATPSAATISDSGSTNRKAFTIVINYDDTATVTQDGATRSVSPTAAQVTQLYTDIMANLPLSNVQTNNGCTKSASYGSTTMLAYNASTTQDISCPPSSTSPAQTLYNDVTAIETQVGPFNN